MSSYAFTYADPRVCPSCRTTLAQPVAPDTRCVQCDVPLGHPLATEAFESLRLTDVLVTRLRAVPVAVPAAAPAPAPAPATTAVPALVPDLGPALPPLRMPERTGVRTSSVPAILLSLGALCLLVAAVTFLAVAWTWLGFGGRTAVLVGLTAASGAGGLALAGRGLRVAGEALTTVSLGLLVLDVLGADRAGWLGDPSGAGLALATGLVLAAGGAVLASGARRLVVPQVVAVGGLFVAQAALPSLVGHDLLVAAVAAAAFVALVAGAREAGATVAAWSAGVAAALAWADLALSALVGIDATDDLTFGGLWTTGEGVALATAALLLLAPLAVVRDDVLDQLCGCAAATMVTAVVALPVLDNGATEVALASLVAGALWTAVAHLAPRSHLAVPAVPAGFSLLPATFVAVALTGQAVAAALTPTADLTLDPADPVAASWLLVPTVVALATLVLAVVPSAARQALAVRVLAAAVLLAATATLALHPVPLWTVVAALAVVAAAYVADGLRRPDAAALAQVLAALALLAVTLVVAGPSTGLLLLPLVLLSAAAAAVVAVGRFPGAAEVGGLLLAPALAATAWVLGDLAGLDAARAVPVLVVLAAVAAGRARPEVEVPAALAALVAAASAVPLATDEATSLALHLTLGGALVVGHSLVHPSRRPVAWAGSALLVLATWVRLVDTGVTAPEAYTLPTAVALVVVGLLRMRRDPAATTTLALLPGLALATVPSYLQVLAGDPVTMRAALLGAACLALAVGGAQLRWNAPLLVGSVVGALLTLRELAPYAAETPQWVVIGLAGTTLVVVGTTWERRVVELRRAASYVGRLR